jgi:hypothetical protein
VAVHGGGALNRNDVMGHRTGTATGQTDGSDCFRENTGYLALGFQGGHGHLTVSSSGSVYAGGAARNTVLDDGWTGLIVSNDQDRVLIAGSLIDPPTGGMNHEYLTSS